MKKGSEPKVSVITVSYNAESEIEETILSVIGQDYPNIEYIIVDGGSKDNTIEIVRKYESNISKWISEPDKGCYDAMNKGIDLANGEWIIFMNSGDSFFSNDSVRNALFNAMDYDVIYGDTKVVADFGSYEIRPFPVNFLDKGVMPFYHQSCFVRTSIMRRHKFNLKYKICADFEVFYSIRKTSTKFFYLPLTLSNYNISGGSLSFDNPMEVYKENFVIMNNYDFLSYYNLYKRLAKWIVKKLFFKLFSTQDYKSKYFRNAVKNNKFTKSISW